MKRTLSLVLALVMVLGSFTAVFAAEPATNEAAEFLAQEGVLLGADGDLMLENNLERRDAVVLLSRLLGVEEEAAEFLTTEESPSWEDARTDAYYVPYFAWAQENEYFEGDDEGNFNPRNAITAQEYALVLLRAMGHDVKGHDAWAKALETAKEAGLLEGVEVENKDAVVRGQMAVMTLNALKAENGKLAEKLGIELPVPAALEVAAVTADNLKEVEVVFNQEVDVETVTDANVKVKGQAGSVVLKDDGVTAVITLNDGKELTNQKEYTLLVEGVKATAGLEIEKTELKFKTFDAELPEALEVAVTGPRQLTITFSEPIKTAGKVTIKQDKVTLGSSVALAGNKAHVTAFSNFVEGKEYEVTVENFVDYAEYKNIINVLTFTYEKDATPPVATVEKVEQTYVVVSFNKPVKGLKASSFYHTFTAWTAQGIYKDSAMTQSVSTTDSVDKVYVKFYVNETTGRAIPAGSTLFGINGKDIKDNWGNALGNQEFTISAVADRVAPEVKEIEVVGEDKLKITFSKDVTFARKNIEILDNEGKKISGLFLTVAAVDGKADQYTVEMNKKLAGKTVTINIKDVEDTSLFKNVLSLYTEVIEITDKTAPKVSKAYYNLDSQVPATTGDTYNKSRELYVQFDEAVDAETALVASNYALVYGSELVILTEAPSFDALESRVRIPLTAKQANKLGENAATVKLQVINVKDIAGNAIAPVINDVVASISNTTTVTINKVVATSKKQLEVEFNDLLSNVKPADFTITVNGDVYSNFSLTQADSSSKTTLKFEFENNTFSTDAANISFTAAVGNMLNSFGEEVTAFVEKVDDNGDVVVYANVDEIKPEIAKVGDPAKEVITASGNTVTIKFTENMATGTFSTLSFAVEGRKVTAASITTDTLELTVDGDAITSTTPVRVSYEQKVTDVDGNELSLDLGTVIEVQ